MEIISFLYIVVGTSIATSQIRSMIRKNKITIMNCVKLMYAFVYGFLPAIIYIRNMMGISNWRNYHNVNLSSSSLCFLIFAILGYFSLSLGYQVKKSRKTIVSMSESTLIKSGILILIIGWGSLILWTKADGGIMNFISHADGIRAGYYKLQNSFAFMQNTTHVIMFSFFILCSIWIKANMKKRICVFPFLILSLIGSLLFIMAWDSRATMGFLVLIIYFMYVEFGVKNNNVSMRKKIIQMIVVFVITFLIMILSSNFMLYIRGVSYTAEHMNIFSLLEKEFGFIITTQTFVYENMFDLGIMIFKDILLALVSWIPTRFIPFPKPESIWSYNTLLIASGKGGTIPTDFISGSIYQIGIIGIIVIPFIMGMILKKLDTYLDGEDYSAYGGIIKASIMALAINSVSHFSFAAIMQGVFYIVLGHIITKMIDRRRSVKLGKEKM